MLNNTTSIAAKFIIRILSFFALTSITLTGCQSINQPLSQRFFEYANSDALVSDYNAALADISIAIALDPVNPVFYILRGKMYLAIYEWDNAGADFDHAIEFSPNYAPAYFHRGVLYYSILQTGLTTREYALADFQRYLELDPDGEFAAQAAEYIENIERELQALNG